VLTRPQLGLTPARPYRALLSLLCGLLFASLLAARPSPVLAQPLDDTPESLQDLRIVVISDLNERYGDTYHRETVHSAVARILQLEPDIVLVTGDMVAGQRAGLDYGAMWSAFHEAVSDPLSAIPIAVAPGNHDASALSRYEEERAIYVETWRQRRPLDSYPGLQMVDGADYPLRYAFTLGPVLFIALDATHRSALEHRDQLDWLADRLRRVDRDRYPVVVLFAHFPLYPFAQDRERDYLLSDSAVRARVEDLLAEHDVTLFLSGHHHSYYPGRRPDAGLERLRLVGLGCLGGGPRALIGEEREIDTDDPTERSFVVIDVDDGEIVSLEAYRGPEFGPADRIDRADLPPRIGVESLPIVRDDL
jgi:predicted MPP superfamily phosphohydrolase